MQQNDPTQIRILLVDANPTHREITRKMLRFYDANFQVDTCGSISECIQLINQKPYDLLLTEEKLEDGDSFELIATLKRDMIHLPVLMLFAEGEEEKAMAAIEAGAADYMTKSRGYLTALPFTVKKILERQKFESRRQRAALETQEPPPQIGYFILDPNGNFVSANPGMTAITGYAEDELLELSFLDLLPKGTEWAFFEWLQRIERDDERSAFKSEIIGKFDKRALVAIKIKAIRNEEGYVRNYRGEMEELSRTAAKKAGPIDEKREIYLIDQLWGLIERAREDPLPKLLGRLAQLSCQIFQFKRSTLAILDREKKSYIKVAMVGYTIPAEKERRQLEVPRDVIERIFQGKYRIKVLYHEQDRRTEAPGARAITAERRSQRRRPPGQWHPRDVVVINLADRHMNSFGYISLDDPLESFSPDRSFFHNLELFSRLASMIIEIHKGHVDQLHRNRRLNQALVTSNIFKLYLQMDELLREIVWSVKFSLGFNLVILGLVSRKSKKFEIRSVACEDKIKAQQIVKCSIDLDTFLHLFDAEYQRGKSYFIPKAHPALAEIKEIYYLDMDRERLEDEWPFEAALVAPLKSRFGKIMGAIIVDDPADHELPDPDQIRTLEILATQISVAIENRLLYVEARRQAEEYRKAALRGNRHTFSTHKTAEHAGSEKARPRWYKFFKFLLFAFPCIFYYV